MAFSFAKWRSFVETWAEAHRAAVPGIECIVPPDIAPCLSLAFKTGEVIGAFRFWENGQTDFEVFSIALDMAIAHETGIIADDETFELEFGRFLAIAEVA